MIGSLISLLMHYKELYDEDLPREASLESRVLEQLIESRGANLGDFTHWALDFQECGNASAILSWELVLALF